MGQDETAARLRFHVAGAHPPHKRVSASPISASATSAWHRCRGPLRLTAEEEDRASREPPSPLAPPSGCRFRTRCPHADARCSDEEPRMRLLTPDHWIACHHPHTSGNVTPAGPRPPVARTNGGSAGPP
ncbi:oligopeptide/dipeptide ABC transporter ATP-binding protein [Nonomuraea roseola]|uniref:Oligopeptide/dipeptide ABC transporter ATP-binding protein n=1 Tax=Nonomuraea roseola TaxID=46179 RepID=A0ABV5PVG5_9ACTN